MLLVRAHLGPSSIHGIGLFATDPIPAGTEVWCFSPGWDIEKHPDEVAALPAHIRELVECVAYLDDRLNRMIYPFDDARFVNHSDTPNTATDRDRDPPYGVDIAVRDIAAGEEITADYRTF